MVTKQPTVRQRRQAVENGLSSTEAPVPRLLINGTVHEFPGCRAINISRDEIAVYDGRYEFWDAKTETALMVREPTSPYHERSSVHLARMTDRIAAAAAVLRRVGRLMGKARGTGPDNDPFLREERAESRHEGRIEGRDEGRIEGRVETLEEILGGLLGARGIAMSARFKALVATYADRPGKTLLDAARACRNEDDFAARIAAIPRR